MHNTYYSPALANLFLLASSLTRPLSSLFVSSSSLVAFNNMSDDKPTITYIFMTYSCISFIFTHGGFYIMKLSWKKCVCCDPWTSGLENCLGCATPVVKIRWHAMYVGSLQDYPIQREPLC